MRTLITYNTVKFVAIACIALFSVVIPTAINQPLIAYGNDRQEINQRVNDELLAGNASKPLVPKEQAGECATLSPSTWGNCVLSLFESIINILILPVFTFILKIGGLFFEYMITLSILKFKDITDGWLEDAWRIVRDILNVGVIFVLLYSAIQIIIGRQTEVKKIIAGVILFGVLTNFSLFFGKAIVDISNIVALEFYNQMRQVQNINEPSYDQGIAATVAGLAGVAGIYDDASIARDIEQGSTPGAKFGVAFGSIFILLMLTFVFIQAGILFLVRFGTLMILLILSPLMFAGGVFRPLEPWTKKWRDEFLSQALWAPLFFILLYIAITISRSLQTGFENIEFQDSSVAGLVASIIKAAVTVMLFSFAIKQAKEWSGSFSGTAIRLGQRALSFGAGMTLGGAAMGMRTVGRIARLDKAAAWAENKEGLAGSTARFVGMNKWKDATFDVRNSKVAQTASRWSNKALSTVGVDTSGIDLGAGSKTTLKDPGLYSKAKDKYKKATEAAQQRADTRAEARVQQKLKDIEDDKAKDGIRSDYSVFKDTKISYIDDNGDRVNVSRSDGDTDEMWAKKIKNANTQNKKYIDKLKTDELKNTSTQLLKNVSNSGILGLKIRDNVAEYRAREKLSKQFKESDEAKLQAYRDTLVEKYGSITGITKQDVAALKDEEVIAAYKMVEENLNGKLNSHKKELEKLGKFDPRYAQTQKDIRQTQVDLNYAKSAAKKMEELKKKISSAKDKKDDTKKDGDSKKSDKK